jgi:hypothetical protein
MKSSILLLFILTTASTTVDKKEIVFRITFQIAFAEEVTILKIHRAKISRAFGNLSKTSFHNHTAIFLIHLGKVSVPNFQQAWPIYCITRGIFANPLLIHFPNCVALSSIFRSCCLHHRPKPFRFLPALYTAF